MKVNGTNIMEFEHYDLKTLNKIAKEGKEVLRVRSFMLTPEEKSFLKVVDGALLLNKMYTENINT